MNANVGVGLLIALLLSGCGNADEQGEAPRLEADAPGSAERPASEPTSGPREVDAGWVVDFSSYGPVPLGVPFEEADAAAGGALEAGAHGEGCGLTRLVNGRDDVWLMVVDGRLTRVDVHNPVVATAAGARIGDPEDRIRDLHPTVEVQPHKYTEGNYLIVSPGPDARHRIIFETDGAVVRNYRAGALPEVAWVERCG